MPFSETFFGIVSQRCFDSLYTSLDSNTRKNDMSDHSTSIRALEQKLKVASRQKRRFGLIAAVAVVLLLVIIGIIYKRTVLDYARIQNVNINQQGNTPKVEFDYEVVASGKIEYRYGEAVLFDRVEPGEHQSFTWSMGGDGEAEVAIKSRGSFLPEWHTKQITWTPEVVEEQPPAEE